MLNPLSFFSKQTNISPFSFVILGLFACAFVLSPYPTIAKWFGFLIAGYAAVANDSIQTIGTFISSNRSRPWWLLWLFIGGIFVGTITYSWLYYGGDVSYGRLSAKGFDIAPTSFSFLQIAAPIILLIVTRLKMPVSTTFLLLTVFSSSAKSVGSVLTKSLTGYFLAFVISFAVWFLISKIVQQLLTNPAHPSWRVAQWLTTGLLWSVWLMQDAANIAVFLPRQLTGVELIAFIVPITIALGIMLKKGGAKIQEIVDKKTTTYDVRSATIIDFVYAIILFYFKLHSKIPMSTTWVFLGLLSGREIALSIRRASKHSIQSAILIGAKETGLALIGLGISFIVATLCNPAMRDSLLSFF